jgi:steroid delta-isomerase-like uncharacterized protein
MTTQNKNNVRRLFDEAWSKGNMAVIDEVVAPNVVSHDPANPNLNDREALKQMIAMYRGAFNDLRMTIDEQIVEGDKVVTRWTARGTHSGPLMGVAPTHKKCTVTGMQIDHCSGGKITETWTNWDTAGLMQQLGVVPPMGTGTAARPARVHK